MPQRDRRRTVIGMYARIVTFTLDGPSAEQYRSRAESVADSSNEWQGLHAKLWIADVERRRYGGIYLFESAGAAALSRSRPEFVALAQDPAFTDLEIEEFTVLAGPSAVTGGEIFALFANRVAC
jgi:hypothetical protein